MTTHPLVRAQSVGRRLGTTTILHELDLDVAEGEFLALTGPSGCGKSTLLHTLSGLEAPDSGRVLWAGVDLGGLSPAQRSRHRLLRIGQVFQQYHLVEGLSLLDNVLLPGLFARAERRSVLRERARGLLEKFGVAELAERSLGEASGGQLQRVALARALINRPRLLIADEPTGALDSAASTMMLEALRDLHRQGLSIVLVTHDAEVAARAERVVSMLDGRLVAAPAQAA